VRQHLRAVAQHEARVVTDGPRHVPHLHPALGLPPHEFDLARVEMRAPRDGGRAVVLLHPLIDHEAAVDEVARHRRPWIRRGVLDVRPVHVLPREGEVGGDGVRRVVRVADDEPANHQHPVTMQDVDGRRRRVARAPPVLARAVLRAGLQEREVVLEDVLDPEKHVAETGLPHQGRELLAVRRNRGRHPLHHVIDVGEAGVDDRLAEDLEALDVQRDVVVDDEDGPRAAAPRVGDVGNHPRDWKAVEVPPAHLDDRAEAAVERAAARRLDDIHRPPHHRVAGEHPRLALRRRNRVLLDGRDGPGRRLHEHVALAKPQTRNGGQGALQIERTQQLAKGQFPLAAHDRVHAERRMRPCIGREARVVPTDDDERLGPHGADERDEPPRGRALERHHRQPDHIRCAVPDQLLDRLTNG